VTENTAVQEVTEEALTYPDMAEALVITDQASYERAGKFVIGIKKLKKKITDTFKPMKQAADAAKRVILDQEKEANAPIKEAESIVSGRMIAWDQEQRRIREEAERAAREKARKEDEERRLKEAEQLETEGDKEAADAVLEDETVVVTPPPMPKPEKPAGVSYRVIYSVDETTIDLKALAEASLKGQIPIQAIQPNIKFLNQQARSLKDAMNWPGVTVTSKQSLAGRTA
jgi:hypothetical protein